MKVITVHMHPSHIFRLMVLLALAALRPVNGHEIASPDGRIIAHVGVAEGRLIYDVQFNGQKVVQPSLIGFEPYLTEVRELGIKQGKVRQSWRNAFGERAVVQDHYTSLDLDISARELKMTLQCRLYNEGFAFRFVLPKQHGKERLTIAQERTEFTFDRDYTCWPVYSAQGYYAPTLISGVHTRRDREAPASVPNAEGANQKKIGRAHV